MHVRTACRQFHFSVLIEPTYRAAKSATIVQHRQRLMNGIFLFAASTVLVRICRFFLFIMLKVCLLHVGCDFLACPENPICTNNSQTFCHCLPEYEENMVDGQLSCVGKLCFTNYYRFFYIKYQTLFFTAWMETQTTNQRQCNHGRLSKKLTKLGCMHN